MLTSFLSLNKAALCRADQQHLTGHRSRGNTHPHLSLFSIPIRGLEIALNVALIVIDALLFPSPPCNTSYTLASETSSCCDLAGELIARGKKIVASALGTLERMYEKVKKVIRCN